MRLTLSRPAALLLLALWSAGVWWLLVSRDVTHLAIAGSSYLNNLAHAVLFGVEALLLGALLAPGRVGRPRRAWLLASLLALAYSGLLEWRQGFTEGRHSSWLDMLTNTVGTFGAPACLSSWPPNAQRVAGVALLALAAAALSTFGPDV